MNVRLLMTAALFFVAAGCVTNGPETRVFSDEWLNVKLRKSEFEARKDRVKSDNEIVFAGKEGELRAGIRPDEEGMPRLFIGGGSRVSADVDLHHGDPGLKLKYKLDW